MTDDTTPREELDEVADVDESPEARPQRTPGGPVRSAVRSRTALVVAGVLVLVVVLGGAAVYLHHRHDQLPADAAFRFQGRTYSQSDLARYDQLQHALYGIAVPDLSQSTQRRAAAQTYAVSLVIDRAAASAGVSVSDAEVSQAESDFISRTYPSGRASFIDALANEGLSENDVLAELRRQLVVKQLYDRVTQDVSVSASDVAAAYEAHRSDFIDPPTRQVSEIVVAGRQEATALRARLMRGGDFAQTARTRSLDSTTSAKGGALGFVARKQLQGPFGAAAFAARPGQVFGPVKATGASYYYLGIVTGVRPAHTLPLAQVRSQLAQELGAARGLSVWEAYLHRQLAADGVEYAAAFRPADPSAVPTGALPSSGSSPSTRSGVPSTPTSVATP